MLSSDTLIVLTMTKKEWHFSSITSKVLKIRHIVTYKHIATLICRGPTPIMSVLLPQLSLYHQLENGRSTPGCFTVQSAI